MPGPGLALVSPAGGPLAVTVSHAANTATAAGLVSVDLTGTATLDEIAWDEELKEAEAAVIVMTAQQAALELVNPAAALLVSAQLKGLAKKVLRLKAHKENAKGVKDAFGAESTYMASLALTYGALSTWANADTA